MDTFNFRNPQEGEVADIQKRVIKRRLAKQRYHVLSQLLAGNKEVDITSSPEIFEALNRERMEFETLMKLPQNRANVQDCIDQAKDDREHFTDGKYWNAHSLAKWGNLGHIPNCCYYARPPEYWKDKKIVREFLNMFPKFRISTKHL